MRIGGQQYLEKLPQCEVEMFFVVYLSYVVWYTVTNCLQASDPLTTALSGVLLFWVGVLVRYIMLVVMRALGCNVNLIGKFKRH